MYEEHHFDDRLESKRLRRLLLATMVGFGSLLAVCFALGVAYKLLSTTAESLIQKLGKRLNLNITVEDKTVGLKTVVLHGVKIHGDPASRITRITVSTSFGKRPIDSLIVHGEKLNLQRDQLRDILLSLVDGSSNNQGNPSKRSSWKRVLPNQLSLNIKSVAVWHDNIQLGEIRGLRLQYSQANQKGRIAYKGISLHGRSVLGEGKGILQGRIDEQLKLRLFDGRDHSGRYSLSSSFDVPKKLIELRFRSRGVDVILIPSVGQWILNHEQLPFALNANFDLSIGNRVRARWSAATGQAKISHPRLAKEPIFPLLFKGQGTLSYDFGKRNLSLYDTSFQIGRSSHEVVKFEAGLRATKWRRSGHKIKGYLKIADTPCSDILHAIPTGLGDVFQKFRSPSGAMGGVVRFGFRTDRPSAFKYKLIDGRLDCHFRSASAEYGRGRFVGKRPVVSRFQLANRYVSEYAYTNTTKLKTIPRHILNAFLISEDAGFYQHNGFSLPTFEGALRKNLRQRRISLGASTISMQTAKNIWLTGERTLARKLQEGLLTLYLEQVLTKDRILEIYLNIVEFGPGIYGLRNAASHFFGKTVGALTTLEAIYLASLLPSPVRRYRYFCQNRVTPAYRKLLDQKLQWLVQFQRIDLEDYNAAKNSRIQFSSRGRANAQHCTQNLSGNRRPIRPAG